MKIPTKHETAQLLEIIRENPQLVQGLTEIQFHEVKKMIQGQIETGAFIATRPMLSENPPNEQQINRLKKLFVTPHRDFLQTLETLWNDRNYPKIPEKEDEKIFNDGIEQIVLLYEIGFFDFLVKKFGEHSPKRTHQLVFQLLGIKPDTVRKDLERIDNDKSNTQSAIYKHLQRAKTQIGDVKPTSDVLK